MYSLVNLSIKWSFSQKPDFRGCQKSDLFWSLLTILGPPKNRIFEGVTSFGHFLHFWHFWLKKGQPQCILVLQMTLLDIFQKRKMHVFADFGELSRILGLLKFRYFDLFSRRFTFGQQTSNLKIFLTDF